MLMKTSGSFAEVKDKYRTPYIYCHRACIIFSIIAKANLGVDDKLTAASMVWQCIGQIVFNMLILVGTIKLPDRIVTAIVNEFIKKIIVHEADKSSGHRRQTVEIVFNFVGQIEIPILTEPVTLEAPQKQRKTA